MPFRITDFKWTPDGDFLINENGDIASFDDSGERTIDYFRNVIAHRLNATKSDWRRYPELSAGLDRAIGMTVNQDTLNTIRAYVKSALTIDLFIRPSDLQIRTIDIGEGGVVIMIWIPPISGDQPIGSFVFDIQTGEFISRLR